MVMQDKTIMTLAAKSVLNTLLVPANISYKSYIGYRNFDSVNQL
jgi:hypothetical protein